MPRRRQPMSPVARPSSLSQHVVHGRSPQSTCYDPSRAFECTRVAHPLFRVVARPLSRRDRLLCIGSPRSAAVKPYWVDIRCCAGRMMHVHTIRVGKESVLHRVSSQDAPGSGDGRPVLAVASVPPCLHTYLCFCSAPSSRCGLIFFRGTKTGFFFVSRASKGARS